MRPLHKSDGARIQAAIDQATGKVPLESGVFTVPESLVLKDGVWLEGQGIGATTLRLADGAAGDVVRTAGFDSLTGTDAKAGPTRYGVSRLTIDGNKDNCPDGGWGLRQFGGGFHHHDIEIANCKAGGLWTEWGTGDPAPPGINANGQFSHFNIHDCDGIGVEHRGPHDAVWVAGNVYRNKGGADVYIAGNAGGTQWSDIHVYGQQVFSGTPYSLKIDAGLQIFRNVVVECALGGAILILGSGSASDLDVMCYWGGLPNAVRTGVTLGVDPTDAVHGCRLKVARNGTLTDGAIVYVNDAGGNVVDLGTQPFVNAQGDRIATDGVITTLDVEKMPITKKLIGAGADVTGAILEQSSVDGAGLILVNNSGFSIAFAAQPVSHVFTGLTIAAYSQQGLTYSVVMRMWVKA